MGSRSDDKNTKGTMTISPEAVRWRLTLKEGEIHAQATRTPVYDYLQGRKAAARRRNRQKKRAIEAKKDWDIMKKQLKKTDFLVKRLESLVHQNDELILQIIDLLSLPNQDPDLVKYVKEMLSLLTGNSK